MEILRRDASSLDKWLPVHGPQTLKVRTFELLETTPETSHRHTAESRCFHVTAVKYSELVEWDILVLSGSENGPVECIVDHCREMYALWKAGNLLTSLTITDFS
jgi:hypothetical protein